jgi:hypothetical protein
MIAVLPSEAAGGKIAFLHGRKRQVESERKPFDCAQNQPFWLRGEAVRNTKNGRGEEKAHKRTLYFYD